MKTYQFTMDSRRIGPIPLILGGIVGLALLAGLIVFASMFAIIALGVGLILAAVGGIALAVRRVLGLNQTKSPTSGDAPKISEVRASDIEDLDGVKEVEVEIVGPPDPTIPR